MSEVGLEPLPVQKVVPLPADGWDATAGPAEQFEAQARYFAGYLIDHVRSPKGIDAIMVPTDAHCYPVAAACRMLGREPNHDVVLAGYDSNWEHSVFRQFEPTGPAVTVDRLNADLGREMVRLLSDRAEGRLAVEAQCRRVAPTLVVTGALKRLPIEEPVPVYGFDEVPLA